MENGSNGVCSACVCPMSICARMCVSVYVAYLWPMPLYPVHHRERAPVLAVLTRIDHRADAVVAMKAPQSFVQCLNVVRHCGRTYEHLGEEEMINNRWWPTCTNGSWFQCSLW